MLLVFVAPIGMEAAAPALPPIANHLGVSDAQHEVVTTALIIPSMAVRPVTGIPAALV